MPARRRSIAATARRPTTCSARRSPPTPNFTYAWVNLSNVTFSTEEFNAALSGGEQGAAQASEGERMLLEFNKLFLDERLRRAARARQAARPRSIRTRRAPGWCWPRAHGALNQFAEQRAVLEKVIALAPGFSPAPFALGASYLFNDPKDFAKAEKYYRMAVAAAPGNDMYYWSLGDVYRGSNKLEEARRYYQLALQLDPNDPTAPLKLGHVNSFLGNFDEARKDYDHGIKAGGAGEQGIPRAVQVVHLGVRRASPRAAIKSLENLVGEIDGFGAAPDQRLNAKVFALTERRHHRDVSAVSTTTRSACWRRARRLMRENAKVVGTEAFSKIQETQIAFFDGQLAAWRGDYKAAAAQAKKDRRRSSRLRTTRARWSRITRCSASSSCAGKNYKKAVAELRQADLTQLHVKYQLAQALEGAGQKDEALKLYKEVSVNNFNTVDFALLRGEAAEEGGLRRDEIPE